MTEEIKARIESIRKGEVPNGYSEGVAGILPNDWTSKPLSEISEVIAEQAGDDDYETLSISAGIGFVNQAQKFGKELSGKQYEKYTVLRKGDFAYNKGNSKRYPQGCTYRLKERDEAAVPNVFECFRISEGCPEYYEQLFINGYMNRQLTRKINHGVRDDGLLNLTDADFYSTVLPVPPLTEQQKIAEILSTCNKVIELKQQLLTEKKKQKTWLIHELLIEKKDASESTRYKKVKIGDLAESLTGFPFDSSTFCNSGIRLMRCGNIGLGKTSWEPKSTAFFSNYEDKLKSYALQEGDIVIGMDGASVGKSCAVISKSDLPCYLVQRVTRLRTKYTTLIFQWLRSTMFVDYVNRRKTVTAIPHISEQDILNFEILVPQDDKCILQIEQILNTQDTAICDLEKEIELWKQKKKALMQLLLTGTIRVGGQ